MTGIHAGTGGAQLRVAGRGALVPQRAFCVTRCSTVKGRAGPPCVRRWRGHEPKKAGGGSQVVSRVIMSEVTPAPGGGPGLQTLLGELEPSGPDQ